MPITATYVSATSFTVATDLTSDFVHGRALFLNCGADGYKYGYVSYSSYSSPNTTVYLDSTDSQSITANLASVDFSVFKYERVSGNNPLEMLWMTRGVQTVAVTYKDSDEITLKPGVVHLNDGTTEALYQCPGFDKQLTSLSASTWYYIYAKAPSSGRILSATEIEYSSTAPTLDGAKQGYYHPSNTGWRCIGFARSNGSSQIAEFTLTGGVYALATPIESLAYSSGNIDTSSNVTLSIPIGSLVVNLHLTAYRYSTNSTSVAIKMYGSSESVGVCYINADNVLSYYDIYVQASADKKITYFGDTRFGGAVSVSGFRIPSEIFSAGSGGGASATPMFSTASRGLQSCAIEWASTSSFYVNPGSIHIWSTSREHIYQIPSQLTKSVTGLSAATWYAIYAQAPSSGDTLSATEITYSSTMPTRNLAKQGWYDSTGNLRCIGFVWSNSASALTYFKVDGKKWFADGPFAVDVNAATPSNTWTAYTVSVPIGGLRGLSTLFLIYYGTASYVDFMWREYGATNAANNYSNSTLSATITRAVANIEIPTNSSKQFEGRFNGVTTSAFYITTYGFILPDTIYTGPAGGTERTIQGAVELVDRGRKSGLTVQWASTSSITIDGGIIHINDGSNDLILEATSQITKSTSSLSVTTWYYVYVDPPDSGTTLSSSDIEYSSTAPTYSHSKAGWYHPTNTDWRCIGVFRTGGSSEIVKFYSDGNLWMSANGYIAQLYNSSSLTQTPVTVTSITPPMSRMAVCGVVMLTDNNWNVLNLKETGATYGIPSVFAQSTATRDYQRLETPVSSSGQFDIWLENAYTFSVGIYQYGFLFPGNF